MFFFLLRNRNACIKLLCFHLKRYQQNHSRFCLYITDYLCETTLVKKNVFFTCIYGTSRWPTWCWAVNSAFNNALPHWSCPPRTRSAWHCTASDTLRHKDVKSHVPVIISPAHMSFKLKYRSEIGMAVLLTSIQN